MDGEKWAGVRGMIDDGIFLLECARSQKYLPVNIF